MAFQRAGAYLDQSSGPWLDRFANADWYEELRLISTAVLMTVTLILLCLYAERAQPAFFSDLGNRIETMLQPLGDCIEYCIKRTTEPLQDCVEQLWQPISDCIRRTTKPLWDYIHRKLHVLITEIYQESLWRQRSIDGPKELSRGQARRNRRRGRPSMCRFTEFFPFLYIWGWPSRGGVIILEHATAVDCDFLGLNHLNVIRQGRASKQEDEDEICRRLLRLGAKWWDSEDRFRDVEEWSFNVLRRVRQDSKSVPTTRESSQLVVGWPSTGGCWVARFEHCYFRIGQYERAHHQPDETALLRLARTMDEKCQVLRDHFDAKFYENVMDVEDDTFFDSWETKFCGEVGPMMVLRDGVFEAASPGPAWWRPEVLDDEDDEEEYDEDND